MLYSRKLKLNKMKKLVFTKIIATIIMLAICYSLSASDSIIKDTTINNVVHSMYKGSKGGKYIIMTSKKGTTYRKYFKSK